MPRIVSRQLPEIRLRAHFGLLNSLWLKVLARSVPEEFTLSDEIGEISESKSAITLSQLRDPFVLFVFCFIDCTTHICCQGMHILNQQRNSPSQNELTVASFCMNEPNFDKSYIISIF
jgi:hypothetical protein